MIRWIVSVLLLAAAFGALQLFWLAPKRQSLAIARREASLCLQERMALQHRVADLEGRLSKLKQTSIDFEAASVLQEWEILSLLTAHDELVCQLENEISSGQVSIERLRDRLTVDLIDGMLFPSGETDLKETGKEVLHKVGDVLNASQSLRVIAQEHTGEILITDRLLEVNQPNWALAAARAVNVIQFLQDVAGMDPAFLSASARSEYCLNENLSTPGGRAKGHRLELVLVPLTRPENQQEEQIVNEE